MIEADRWQKFSLRDQLGHIASEIRRAHSAKEKKSAFYNEILEKAIVLVDMSLRDSRWRKNPLPILFLKNELARAYTGEETALERISMAI